MSIIITIKNIEAQLTELKRLKDNYDPGAGLTVWAGSQDNPLRMQLAYGDTVLEAMLEALRKSHEDMLALARIELKELQSFLKDR